MPSSLSLYIYIYMTHWSGNKIFIKTNLGDVSTKLGVSNRFQPAVYTVVHEESESEVQNTQVLQENLKNSISFFQNFYFLTRSGVTEL